MNEGLFIILYLILVEKLNWELYCFSNQDKFFIFWSIKHFEVMGWEMLIKALALVSSFQGKIIQRVMNKKMREEIGSHCNEGTWSWKDSPCCHSISKAILDSLWRWPRHSSYFHSISLVILHCLWRWRAWILKHLFVDVNTMGIKDEDQG